MQVITVSGRCYQNDFSPKVKLCSVQLLKKFSAFEQAFLGDK